MFSIAEFVLTYNQANRAVAILCNHKRTAPKSFDEQMQKADEKIQDKMDKIKEKQKEVKRKKSVSIKLSLKNCFFEQIVMSMKLFLLGWPNYTRKFSIFEGKKLKIYLLQLV